MTKLTNLDSKPIFVAGGVEWVSDLVKKNYIGKRPCLGWHRIDGPAVIYDGLTIWAVNDKIMNSNKQYQDITGLTDEEMTILVLKYGWVR